MPSSHRSLAAGAGTVSRHCPPPLQLELLLHAVQQNIPPFCLVPGQARDRAELGLLAVSKWPFCRDVVGRALSCFRAQQSPGGLRLSGRTAASPC